MWPLYLHHLTLHFPIVMTMVLASIGVFSWKHDSQELQKVMHWGGNFTLIATTIALISGLIAAPGLFGGEGTENLRHHRDLAITTWCVIALAAGSYHHGRIKNIIDFRRFGITMWCVAVLGVIGTGHWGGSEKHPDSVPWYEQTQVVEH